VELRRNYEGDIRALFELGFDGAKYDRCGVMLNSTLYAELMNATGKAFLIENCHWGICTADDASSCPTSPSREWAPFNFFRTSGDVRETWNSVVRNLLTAMRFLDERAPLSGPHAWAYPDLLQVGNLATAAHDRAHFGAWAIISAPLYLSFDLRDGARMDRAWPLITNREAIAVNQAWAGHPGRLVRRWTPEPPPPPPPSSSSSSSSSSSTGAGIAAAAPSSYFLVTADLNSCQAGWSFSAATGQVRLEQGDCSAGQACGCISVPPQPADPFLCGMVGPAGWHQPSFRGSRYCDDATLLVAPCDAADPAQRFSFTGDAGGAGTPGLLSSNATGAMAHVRAQPWYEGAAVQLTGVQPRTLRFDRTAGGGGKATLRTAGSNLASDVCLGASATMDNGEALLLWAKPQPGGAVAVLLVNNHPTATYTGVTFSTLEVGFAGAEAAIRDVWTHTDIGRSAGGVVTLEDVPARDSRFVVLTPTANSVAQ
jgi:hypothetical protein